MEIFKDMVLGIGIITILIVGFIYWIVIPINPEKEMLIEQKTQKYMKKMGFDKYVCKKEYGALFKQVDNMCLVTTPSNEIIEVNCNTIDNNCFIKN